MSERKRLVLERLLAERSDSLYRPARRFLDGLLGDEALLSRMQFCRSEERSKLRNSVLISTEETPCWSVLLGNEPGGGPGSSAARARLALEGLDLGPIQLLERLRELPVWFLALDLPDVQPTLGEALSIEQTVRSLMTVPWSALHRIALLDQIDAALDDGDLQACHRLWAILPGNGLKGTAQ